MVEVQSLAAPQETPHAPSVMMVMLGGGDTYHGSIRCVVCTRCYAEAIDLDLEGPPPVAWLGCAGPRGLAREAKPW